MPHCRSVASLLSLMMSAGLVGAAPSTVEAVAAERPASGWGPVANLTRPAPATYGPGLAVDPKGGVLAIWVRGDGARAQLMASWQRGGGRWTPPRRVPHTRGAVEAKAAFDGRGRLDLAWTVGRSVRAVRRTAAGSWGTPTTIHRTPGGVRGTRPGYLDLAVNAHGEAVVAWQTVDDDQDATYARSRAQVAMGSPSGGWSTARTLSSPRRDGFRPNGVVTSAGRITVLWTEARSARAQLMAASRSPKGVWSAARPLTAVSRSLGAAGITALPAGDVAVAWSHGGSRAPVVEVKRWRAGRGWGRASGVPAVHGQVQWLDLGIARSGRVTVGWTTKDAAVWAADQTSAGRWSSARVAPAGSVFYGLQVLVDPAGDAVMGWDGQGPGDRHVVRAAYRPHTSGWGGAVGLSDPRGDAGGLALALGGHGKATAAWLFGPSFRADQRIQARRR